MRDVVIKGGTVVDGSGAPAREADVAIDGDRIVEVGADASPSAAHRVVDADGLLVTPGWVDMHTHYDAQATLGPVAHAVVVARRHHRGDGQLRRRASPRPRPTGTSG